MEEISREQFLESLQGDWQNYVARFQKLSPQEQQAFLEKQGYASLSALLSHILAWWQDGEQMIQKMRGDPSAPLGEYDVDAFNARAVEKFSTLGEAEVRRRFEAQRQAMANLVASLPQAELEAENINTRLNYELIMHWTEHAMD